MKVLVFDKKELDGYVSPENKEGAWWIADCVATEIDIPDSCVLAVVDVDDFIPAIRDNVPPDGYVHKEKYYRIIQEVKLQ